ncbi:MAG: hypothetical protein SFV17_10370 [Candidatus Obscuribacter sp.]|nr:hypothetical protein [Candidatus Obscuribacter sp.]
MPKNFDNWNNLDPERSKGPVRYGIKLIVIIFTLACFGGVLSYTAGWFRDAGQVVQEEFSPSALLKKYEWFKDASAQLDAKKANIDAAQARINAVEDQYKGVPRGQWARTDAEQFNLWQTEVAGLKANYNSLAAQYNAAMVKFNYRFTNVGDLPAGATEPLPRAYKPYQ